MIGPLDVAKSVSAGVFGGLALLRGARSLHPDGVAFHATLEVEPDPPGLRPSAYAASQAVRG